PLGVRRCCANVPIPDETPRGTDRCPRRRSRPGSPTAGHRGRRWRARGSGSRRGSLRRGAAPPMSPLRNARRACRQPTRPPNTMGTPAAAGPRIVRDETAPARELVAVDRKPALTWSQREPESAAYTRLPMVRRSNTSRHSRSAAAAGPVFVDRSGRRVRRLRLVGGIILGGVVLYVSMIATAFFGGSDVSTPFLPQPQAESDAGRPLPGNTPAPDPVQ